MTLQTDTAASGPARTYMPETQRPHGPDDAMASVHWTIGAILALYELPLLDLLHRAQEVHRAHHDPARIQLSTLLSVKTGGCPEDCAYCPQSARYQTPVQAQATMPLQEVLDAARQARAAGAQRF